MKPKTSSATATSLRVIFGTGLAISLCQSGAFAQTTRTWTGTTDSNLNTSTNWSPSGSPTTNDTLNFNGTDTSTSGANALIINAIIGGSTGLAALNVTQTNALDFTATTNNGIRLNNGGTFTVSAGAGPVTFGSGARLILGTGSGTQSLTLTNNSSNAVTVASNASTNWRGGTGTRNVTIGGSGDWTFNAAISPTDSSLWNMIKSGGGTLELAAGGGFANLNASGGLVKMTAGTYNLASGGGSTAVSNSGTLTVDGATLNITGGAAFFPIGATSGQTATMNLASGTVSVSNSWGTQVGQAGNGILNIAGGTFTATDTAGNGLKLAEGTGTTGVVNLNGGTLNINRIGTSSGTGTFYFNGGTLAPTVTNNTNWFSNSNVSAQVRNGGAIIDTGGFSVTVGQALLHSTVGGDNATDGGLTKLGAGTLTLTGSSTYTGATTVSGGSVALGSTGSIANSSGVVLNGGDFNVSAVTGGYALGFLQTLAGSGSVTGDLTVNGTLGIGASPGTITFNDDLTLGGGAVSNFEFTVGTFTAGSFDLALGGAGTQSVIFGGTLNLFFDSGEVYANGSSVQIFDFENYAGGFSTFTFTGLGGGQAATFDAATGVVTVIPEPAAAALGAFGLILLLRRRR